MSKQENKFSVLNSLEKVLDTLIPSSSYRNLKNNGIKEIVYQPAYGKEALFKLMGKALSFPRWMFDADKYSGKLADFIKKNNLDYQDPDENPPQAAFYTQEEIEAQTKRKGKEKKKNQVNIDLGYALGTNQLSYGYLTDDGRVMPLRSV
jgi:hypothetical protein